MFSKTAGFRHGSIKAGTAAVKQLGADHGFTVEASEDAALFTPDSLKKYQVVMFLNTTGHILDDDQRKAFTAFIQAGNGFVGVHSATDTEYDWPFYGELVGAYFKSHPAIQAASIKVEVADHPATVGLASPWSRTDEWYDFRTNPRAAVTVLATVDETSYAGGTMGGDHPIAWAHPTAGGGRALYTAMGHTQASYADPAFRRHLVGALRWVAGQP